MSNGGRGREEGEKVGSRIEGKEERGGRRKEKRG